MKKHQTTNENPDYQKHMNAISTVYHFAGLPTKNTFPGLDESRPVNIKKAFLDSSGQKHHERALDTVAQYAGLSVGKVVRYIRHYQQMQHHSETEPYTEAA